ncbi:hypothetical protein EH240_29365 [Mesorhizobium tamadayense]|uniref:Uncharacterized protein n=1 Tax=Mesorhizobium tamadayense TaxID=425306 RepID=A0A3P3F4K1_9HYPH|nr:hypothetical protein [Mesorhizobium tamadayense]RRH93531.1 hypothetical protein EH240_29365 [Mesorhizobium tamadayense]
MYGRGTEARIRIIVETAIRSEGRIKLGSLLSHIARCAGVTNEDVEVLELILAEHRAALRTS